MGDLHDDIVQLSRTVRAMLDDRTARGRAFEPLHSDLPALAPVAVPEGRPEPLDAWTRAAQEAREGPPTGAEGLQRARTALGDCKRCQLCETRGQIVWGVGDPDADLVIVGEAPGAEEDRKGEPFVGAAGQMLDKMLVHVLGLNRSSVYILNVVKCRPPANRNPEPDEMAACRPFLDAQLAALRPKVMLVMGSVAYRALLSASGGITRSRGQWHRWRDPSGRIEVPVMPTFHPAYLLRTPDDKRLTFADLKALAARYDDLGGKRPAG